jgi:hypothetical protein
MAGNQFDVFLAHNSKDKPLVEAIAQELKRRGLNPWLDNEQIGVGSSIPKKVAEGIKQSRSVAFFIGTQGLGKFQDAWEIDALIMECAESGVLIIPVLLPGVTRLPPGLNLLGSRKYLQFTNSIKEPENLNELVQAIRNNAGLAAAPMQRKILKSKAGNDLFMPLSLAISGWIIASLIAIFTPISPSTSGLLAGFIGGLTNGMAIFLLLHPPKYSIYVEWEKAIIMFGLPGSFLGCVIWFLIGLGDNSLTDNSFSYGLIGFTVSALIGIGVLYWQFDEQTRRINSRR